MNGGGAVFNVKLRTCLLALMLVSSDGWSAGNPAAAQITPSATANPAHTAVFVSDAYRVQKVYKSMQGPASTRSIQLLGNVDPQLAWITGYRTVVVGADGITPANQEFLCHNNLDLQPGSPTNLRDRRALTNGRLFTLSQGVYSIEFPAGFGIPVMSNQPLNLTTQVLNHNIENADAQVRHRVEIDFVLDRDVLSGITPLLPVSAYVLASLDGKKSHFGIKSANHIQQGASCLPGSHATGRESSNVFYDEIGQKYTGHWVVPRGREIRRTLVSRIMNLEQDTRIHYVATHVHPFSQSLELRDLTEGKSIYRSEMQNMSGRTGLLSVDNLRSTTGVPVFKGHEYELVSEYYNTSSELQDAMAVMLVYVEDKAFKR